MARTANQILESVVGAMILRDAGMQATLEKLTEEHRALTAEVERLTNELAALRAAPTQEG